MAIDLDFRRKAVRTLTSKIGCYVLCDLDQVPIYVGQSVDGIRARVRRHLTSARSDIIANRQIDVWEIAWVWTYPVEITKHVAAYLVGQCTNRLSTKIQIDRHVLLRRNGLQICIRVEQRFENVRRNMSHDRHADAVSTDVVRLVVALWESITL